VPTDAMPSSLKVNTIQLEIIDRGQGRPLLFLHPDIGIDPGAPVLDRLAAHGRLIAPSHPGFGQSEQPRGFTTVDDLAYFYLDLLDQLDLEDVTIIGVAFGGWIAAEMAVKSTQRIARLVLANSVGIKVGTRETRDIADIFARTEKDLGALVYFDPAIGLRDYKAMADAALRIVARNREATARYAWSPYMHNPKLKGRLHRIRVPTLFLWGAADRVLSETYGRAFCAAITGARFELIERAGHYPHIEQPDVFAEKAIAFIEGRLP
jgi:pimeloyl-ACP methyl ester carboxylesterase